ncbi:hypothetical protein PENSTE_c040G06877 [Penicillium steckii]|uniref:ferric-chelate reductase (NADPH) n=1 Tax=Penicillium steckii TaxID=303698 RepID=A0A1V6SJU7_9EURO|nr:hypothetical protein PENSTE_c040G06877 [Penicillium steckii]
MGQEGKPLKIRIVLPGPLRVKAGQYVNLWLPTVSIMSWTQTHPFMVTSWSPEKQDVLELFVESRRGITKTLHARACFDGSSYSAFVSGPYGASKSMNDFECVLAIATDFGISGIISYLKKLIYGYNTSTSYVRRVHFVWQVQSLGEKFSFSNLDFINYVEIARASESLLNDLLADDLPENGYMLEISFYIKFNSPKEAFGIRAPIYNGEPEYEAIVSEESTGVKIPRVTNTKEEQGKTLVLVSARSGVRDRLRSAVNIQSNRKVCLYETDFQPD